MLHKRAPSKLHLKHPQELSWGHGLLADLAKSLKDVPASLGVLQGLQSKLWLSEQDAWFRREAVIKAQNQVWNSLLKCLGPEWTLLKEKICAPSTFVAFGRISSVISLATQEARRCFSDLEIDNRSSTFTQTSEEVFWIEDQTLQQQRTHPEDLTQQYRFYLHHVFIVDVEGHHHKSTEELPKKQGGERRVDLCWTDFVWN